MSKRPRIIREGPLPDPDKIIIPDKATPVFQSRVMAWANKLVEVLNDLFPPPPGRKWATKYNAKLYPDLILLRAPNLAGWPIPTELLEPLLSLADWQTFARRINAWLCEDHEQVMEEQIKSAAWHVLNDDNPVKR